MKPWYARKPLKKKQILEKLREICDGEDPKLGFCQNSRRWLITMAFNKPKTCTYPQAFRGCKGCGYYEERTPNDYIIRKLQDLRWGTENS